MELETKVGETDYPNTFGENMCGIVGYTGSRGAVEIVLQGLSRLDYRGYDSAGFAVQNGVGLRVEKVSGSVSRLREQPELVAIRAHCGIGHTRWATHGAPTARNAHPHLSCDGNFAVVHNGVIENADALRTLLQNRGHTFASETDTEVIAHLVEEATGSTLEERVCNALGGLEGTYGVAVVSEHEPDKIVVARNGSPVLIGIGDGEFFVASDAAAILEHTRRMIHLEDGDIAVITPEGYRIIDRNSRELVRTVDEISWSLAEVELGDHPNYMHKEIAEQPSAIRRAFSGRLAAEREGAVRLGGLDLTHEQIEAIDRILILGCGTSWHAALVARYMIQELAGIPVTVEYASEFRYLPRAELDGTLAIAVSQSGETADTLEAAREAKRSGARLAGIVNVVGSTLARESDSGIYLRAGPEIGVASTKAFTSQVAALLLVAIRFASVRRPSLDLTDLTRELARLPSLVERALELDPLVEEIAQGFVDARSFLYLGRGISFPVALEGALKLKEISYIHAEGYPAAEMKHGPIALIDETMPVVCVAPADDLLPKMLSNVQEVRARGGRIITITSEGCSAFDGVSDHLLKVPATSKLLSPLVSAIPLQLLAYHIAMLRGCNVDRPRNLAKSVTVE